MRYAIETAPKDGKVLILEDDARGSYDVAHWSAEAGDWVGENSEPSKITPTHWHSMPGDDYLPQEHEGSSSQSKDAPSGSPARRDSIVQFSSSRTAPQRPAAASDVIISRRPDAMATPVTVASIEAQTAPVKEKRAPHAWWQFADFSIAATLVAAAFIGIYFRTEVIAYVTRYVGQQDIFGIGTIGGQIVGQQTQPPSQDSQKADSLARDLAAFQQQAKADRARALAAEAAALETRQSFEKGRLYSETLTNQLVEARSSVNARNLQIDARDLQLRELGNELAMARREIETQAAQLRKTGDDAAQLKQAENAVAELRQSLQQEHDRAEAMARDIESAHHATDPRITPEPAANSQIADVKQALEAVAEQPATVEAQGSPEAAKLIARATALLSQGNIGAARIVLERAAETGSARASFALAETYDPQILSTWGTYGTRGDATKARELYAKAYAGGIQEAKDRFNALRQ